ncbi:MAG: NAD(P)/FAD-dependent oxidoreductase [Sphingobacteriaceae bacterium]|nr:MAG: NAD(P)/FAD-dependent oxidoreductase [Sphingobacteriaceae bacterium]
MRLATLQSIDAVNNRVITDEGEYDYDHLVIATGADTNFFGNKNIQQFSFPMKSTSEALQLRHRLLQNFEEAVLTKDSAELEKLMNVVIVGGGATGVELSGSIAEMRKYILPKDYPEIDFSKMNIILLEGMGKLLAGMSEKSSADSKKYLEKLGVKVMMNTMVNDYDGSTVTLKDGQTIKSYFVIWAAGIKGNVPEGIDKELVTRGNRIMVNRYHQVKGFDNIYAVGDLSYMETPKFPKGHPQVATVAIQHGDNLADNFRRMERKSNSIYEFEYFDKGSMATIGRGAGVVDLPKPKLHFNGTLGWLMWMGLHIVLLLGMKNRIQVFINWIYKFFTHDQNLRLIFKEFYRQPKAGTNLNATITENPAPRKTEAALQAV